MKLNILERIETIIAVSKDDEMPEYDGTIGKQLDDKQEKKILKFRLKLK
jgi:hypothetical protein